MSRVMFGLAAFLLAIPVLLAQEESLESGPKVGTFLPAAFDAYNINGKAKGRQHCLVCEFSQRPVVLVFAREPAEGKDGPLNELMKKLDDAIDAHQEQYLQAGVVFLSPDAHSSANDPPMEDAGKLVEKAKARKLLLERVTARAEKVKNVVVAVYPAEGPKGYNINPKAEFTLLFYDRVKVIANKAFAADKLTEADVDVFLKEVDAHLTPRKKGK